MNPVFDTYRPEGFGTVSPYIFAEDPKALIEFLKHAFYAEIYSMDMDPETDNLINAILSIGDSKFMISQAREEFLGMRTSFYLYVNDVDGMFQRAVDHGAKVVFEPADMDYDDRQGGVIDPAGNYWWISQRLKEEPY